MAGDYNPQDLMQYLARNLIGGEPGNRPAVGVYQGVVLHREPAPIGPSVEYQRAHFRALRLLWKHLTADQRAQYRMFVQGLDHEGHSFIVRGNRSGDHYRIFENGSTLRLRDQHPFCLVLTEAVPFPDMMLAKKLLLERDEGLFLATANDLSDQNHAVRAYGQIMEDRVREAIERRHRLPPRAERQPPEPPTTTERRGRAFLNRIRLRQW